MIENHSILAAEKRNISAISIIIRVIGGGLLSAAILTALALLLSTNHSSNALSVQNIAIRVISGIFYVAVMTPLARRTAYRRFPRFLAIFVPLYITGTLTDLIEAYFYTTLLTPFSLAAALIIEGIPLLLIAGIITWLIPADESVQGGQSFGQTMRERSLLSWCWRIVVAGAPYPAIYLFFVMLVTPLEHAFYYDPAFIASLHTVVPSTMTTIILEVVRGVLFVLAMMPVIAAVRGSRWSTGVYIALIGAMLEAWIPLLGQTSWPVMMRVGNILELTGDACARAVLMALFVALPSSSQNKTIIS
ncbi:hypothetical protein KSF_079420 [Reticulibacter mediterranei]|uniref:Uncharacterized protein n=1 Tax=Reticulibacter mediterranei TaxID=2778369 RepID=A0A8J3IU42_9CHLR|nr:hypothetical protein [Reticulibacter mediterranei]GHO97894.1 hypothetical protein KSF_079420 [Reticulibacter mediterranei]